MTGNGLLLICLQVVLLQTALSYPVPNCQEVTFCNGGNQIIGTLGPPRITGATFCPNGPVVSQVCPELQYGEVSLGGDLPISGTIKVSGCFPVYGLVAVEGTVPSCGSAVVNTGCQFPIEKRGC